MSIIIIKKLTVSLQVDWPILWMNPERLPTMRMPTCRRGNTSRTRILRISETSRSGLPGSLTPTGSMRSTIIRVPRQARPRRSATVPSSPGSRTLIPPPSTQSVPERQGLSSIPTTITQARLLIILPKRILTVLPAVRYSCRTARRSRKEVRPTDWSLT